MGVRIDAYAVDLPRFTAFLNTRLGDLLGEIPCVAGLPKEREAPKETSSKSVLFMVLLALILFTLLFGFLRLQQMFRW